MSEAPQEEAQTEEVSAETELGDSAPEDAVEPEPRQELVTSDESLELSLAEDLAARHGILPVLVAGEINSGKTTLLVALWNLLMKHGAVGKARFAGSRTALGFEARAWYSRLASRSEFPATARTLRETGTALLHLRLAADSRLHELLFTDIAGEVFEEVRQGKPFAEAVPELPRLSTVLVLVNGELVEDLREQSGEFENARRILKALEGADELSPELRVAVVLTKMDKLDQSRDAWIDQRKVLVDMAQRLTPVVECFETAARPEDGSPPEGLDAVIDWLLTPPNGEPRVPTSPVSTDRMSDRLS